MTHAPTVRSRMRDREKAKKFFAELQSWEKFELGDQLVLGDFDWRDWFHSKPTSAFMNALDDERMHWEIMSS